MMGVIYNAPVGTVKSTVGLHFFVGNYYSATEVAEPVTRSLPQIVQILEDGKVSLGVIFSEEQISPTALSNILINLGDKITTLNKEFFEGMLEKTSNRYFFGIRVGEWNEAFVPCEPRELLRLDSVVYTATKDQLKSFIEANNFDWLVTLTSLINKSNTNFANIARLLVEYFTEVDGFSPASLARVIVTCSKMTNIASPQLESVMRRLLDPSYELGIVTSFENDAFSVQCTQPLNTKDTPLVAVDDYEGCTHIGVIVERTESEFKARISKTVIEAEEKGKKRKKVLTGQAVTLGSPVRMVRGSDIEPIFKFRDSDVISLEIGVIPGVVNADGSLFPYRIILKPGENCNGAIIALSGRGKTNTAEMLLLRALMHNRMRGRHLKMGGVVLDKHGEYYQDFRSLVPLFKTEKQNGLIIVDPFEDQKYRIPVERIPFWVFTKITGSQQAEFVIRDLLKALYQEEGVNKLTGEKIGAPKDESGKERLNLVSLQALNWFIRADEPDAKSLLEGKPYHKETIRAALRSMKTAKSLRNIIQGEWDDDEEQYKPVAVEGNLYGELWRAQYNGDWIIINCSRFEKEERSILETLIIEQVKSWREKAFIEDKAGFSSHPLFYFINEEMTESFVWMVEEEIKRLSDMATGARKYRMGYLYIFQSLRGVEPFVVSQAAGFISVLQVPQETDRQEVLRRVPTDFTPYEFYIQHGDTGEAVMSNIVIDTPFPVKVSLFEDLKTSLLASEKSEEDLDREESLFKEP